MQHLTCGISSLLHSVNLILFTLFLVHLIMCISPHHGHHLRDHHLSLPLSFTPDLGLKLFSFTNPFLHSLPIPSGRPSRIFNLYRTNWALAFFVLVSCARLSWSHYGKLLYRIVTHFCLTCSPMPLTDFRGVLVALFLYYQQWYCWFKRCLLLMYCSAWVLSTYSSCSTWRTGSTPSISRTSFICVRPLSTSSTRTCATHTITHRATPSPSTVANTVADITTSQRPIDVSDCTAIAVSLRLSTTLLVC